MKLFNPFEVEFEVLTERDLHALVDKQIEESWFIEYKQGFGRTAGGDPNFAAVLKPIAAFSNAHGGWIFWGIEAERKNTATSIKGIDIAALGIENISDTIAQTIHTGIVPVPTYKMKVIPLANGNSVVVVKVISGQNAPYLTRDGIFYTRVNIENRRIVEQSTLDKLFSRRDKLGSDINAFCRCEFQMSKSQSDSNMSWLELYMFPLPFSEHRIKDFHSEAFFDSVHETIVEKPICLTKESCEFITGEVKSIFNSAQTSNQSILLRQFNDTIIHNQTSSIEFFSNGNCRAFMPLDTCTLESAEKKYPHSKVVEYLLERFMPYETIKGETYYILKQPMSEEDRTERKSADFNTFVDLLDSAHLIWTLINVLLVYDELRKMSVLPTGISFGYRIRVTNMWRKMVIQHDTGYLELLQKFNLPICQYDAIEIPAKRDAHMTFGDMKKIDETALRLADLILAAIGVPKSSKQLVVSAFSNSMSAPGAKP